MKPESSEDLQFRILALLDGTLDESELARLDAELRASREARELYRKLSLLNIALQEEATGRSGIEQVPVIPIERLLARQRRRVVKASLLAAAAVLLVSGLVLWVKMVPWAPPTLGEFRVGSGAVFSVEHAEESDSASGNELREGSQLQIRRGSIEVKLSSGVHCVVEGPADLKLLAGDHVQLLQGTAWFEVPPPAVGFTVETSQIRAVDLGTAFGVLARAGHRHEVHVVKGSVEVSPIVPGETNWEMVLRAGHARRLSVSGEWIEVALDPARFTTALPEVISIRNPNFDLLRESGGDSDPRGYGAIPNWATSGPGIGLSDRTQPFLNQDPHSGSHVAFIQHRGAIAQSASGFDPSKKYTVTYLVSERGLPGAEASTRVSLDLGANSYAGGGKIVRTDAFRRIVSGPLTVFGPTANIQIEADTIAGDATLLIDSVSISRAVPTVADGGFEAPVLDDEAVSGPSGRPWRYTGTSGITDNGHARMAQSGTSGKAPEGSQAAFLLGSGSPTISTIVSGLEPGVTYSLSFEAVGRHSKAGGSMPFSVLLDGVALEFEGETTITPDANGPWASYTSDDFTTKGGALTLAFVGESTGKEISTYLDDIRFNFVAEARE